MLGRSGYAPHEARNLVFIIRDADELNASSANALLKTLEEPRGDVHFILLTSRPHRLLDTIRSRTLPVRFGPLPEAVLVDILARRGLPTDWLELAQGSASAALELADEERRSKLDAFVEEFERALASSDLRPALQLAAKLPSDRIELKHLLLAYAQRLAVSTRRLDSEQVAIAESRAQQYLALQRAVDALERNVGNALAVESLLVELRALRAA